MSMESKEELRRPGTFWWSSPTYTMVDQTTMNGAGRLYTWTHHQRFNSFTTEVIYRGTGPGESTASWIFHPESAAELTYRGPRGMLSDSVDIGIFGFEDYDWYDELYIGTLQYWISSTRYTKEGSASFQMYNTSTNYAYEVEFIFETDTGELKLLATVGAGELKTFTPTIAMARTRFPGRNVHWMRPLWFHHGRWWRDTPGAP